MNKLLDNVYKYSVWIIIVVSIVGYFAYKTLRFDGDLQSTLTSWSAITNLLFVVFLNLTMQSGAIDNAISQGIISEEFILADKLNNKIIVSVNNEMKSFREFIKNLNQEELKRLQEDYLFKIGDKTVDELDDKERKAYDKLKPIQHDIYGFNLPLFYEMTRNGKISYEASFNKNKGKRIASFRKALTGILFGAMTINMTFNVEGIGEAFISVLIISVGLTLTFIMSYVPTIFKLKFNLPKKVLLKNTLYTSYINRKQGSHKLEIIEQEKKEE